MANRCYLCKKEQGSTDHLLIHCDLTRDLWNFVFSLFGVFWVLPFTMKEVLLSWHDPFVGRSKKKVCYAAPLCLFWTVWREWNRRVFENKETIIHKIKSNFCIIFGCGLLFSWFKVPLIL